MPAEERRALAEALQSLLPGGVEALFAATSGASEQPDAQRNKEEGAAMGQWLIDR